MLTTPPDLSHPIIFHANRRRPPKTLKSRNMPDQSRNFQIRRKPVGSSLSSRPQHPSQLTSAPPAIATLTTTTSRPSPHSTWTHLHPDHILTPSPYALLRDHDAIEHDLEPVTTRTSHPIGLPFRGQLAPHDTNGLD